MDHFFYTEIQMIEKFYFDPKPRKYHTGFFVDPFPVKHGMWKRFKSIFGINDDYAHFVRWLKKEKISVEDAISLISKNRNLLRRQHELYA